MQKSRPPISRLSEDHAAVEKKWQNRPGRNFLLTEKRKTSVLWTNRFSLSRSTLETNDTISNIWESLLLIEKAEKSFRFLWLSCNSWSLAAGFMRLDSSRRNLYLAGSKSLVEKLPQIDERPVRSSLWRIRSLCNKWPPFLLLYFACKTFCRPIFCGMFCICSYVTAHLRVTKVCQTSLLKYPAQPPELLRLLLVVNL